MEGCSNSAIILNSQRAAGSRDGLSRLDLAPEVYCWRNGRRFTTVLLSGWRLSIATVTEHLAVMQRLHPQRLGCPGSGICVAADRGSGAGLEHASA